MSKGLRFTDDNFEEEVFNSPLPVLVDFWGSWCPPCKMVEPVIEEIARELFGKLKVGKVNVDQNPRIAARFNISGVPTFMLLHKGEILRYAIGAHSKQQLLNMIKNTLNWE